MPLERRDSHSRAKLFIPTTRERSLVESQRTLNKGIKEVDSLKKELQDLINKAKKGAK